MCETQRTPVAREFAFMVLTRRVALLASLCLTMLTSRASADVWSIAPRVTDHTGLFLRMAVGFSALRLQSRSGEDSMLRGPGLLYDFAIGWSVAPAIAAHLSGFGGFAFAPRLARDGGDSRGHDQAAARLHGLGIGATFHLPLNIYVSPALGVGLAVGSELAGAAPKRDRFDPGFASALDIGWEFWISPQWALGVGAKAAYFYLRDDDGPRERTWHGLALGPLFTATFN